MTKRQFINTVRQFQALAQRKGVSYADSVDALIGMYLKARKDEGALEPELTKEQDWAHAFTLREYGKYDRDFTPTSTG